MFKLTRRSWLPALVLVLLLAWVGCQPAETFPPEELTSDSGLLDAGPVDAGPSDSGVPDSGEPDGGPDAGPDAGPTISYAKDIHPIWLARCVECHFYGSQGTSLALKGSVSYSFMNLMNAGKKTCIDAAGETRELDLVVPGDPVNSALWQKLSYDLTKHTPDLKCGREMPLDAKKKVGVGLKHLAPEEFENIERWISEGALAN
jgi:hypothetical protein